MLKFFFDSIRRAPLHIANQKNNLVLAEKLISAGADVNKIDEDGRTELHHSVEYGRKEMTKLLISKGATMNVIDKDGDSPLKIASLKSMTYDSIIYLIHVLISMKKIEG